MNNNYYDVEEEIPLSYKIKVLSALIASIALSLYTIF